MSGYRCRHFDIRELIPPEIYDARRDGAWELLDPGALMTLDALHDQFGGVVINDWHWGGNFKESGLRAFGTSTGAKWSQHKYGRAFDCKFKSAEVSHVHEYILLHPAQFPYVTTLEALASTPTWLHFDTRNNPSGRIRIVTP